MKMITAIQIDPFNLKVEPVQYDASNHTNIYPLLSHETMKVDTFTAARADTLAEGDAVFVDDEGLLKPCDRFFYIAGCHEALAGKGLIVGSDRNGDEQSAKTPLEKLRVVFFYKLGGNLLPIAEFNGGKVVEL